MNNNPLKSARLKAGLSQTEIAQKIGISQPTYSYLESKNTTINTLSEICEKLNWELKCEILVPPKINTSY